jgi:DNA (cytosine-5)-methyltransferase 1
MDVAQRTPGVVGLFAGIGGIELGLARAGFRSMLLCEIDESARRVLSDKLDGVPVHDDIRTLEELPPCEVIAAGFPCQDLSQAGRTAGISGAQSGLVGEVFRLIDAAPSPPRWLVLENVSFMLSLDRGEAMRWLVGQLESRGYSWAYRVVDSRAFGLPQRRQRVLLVASQQADPRGVLFDEDVTGGCAEDHDGELACGFYWTEGLRGLGWAVDAVPTLKGGSTIGIPSPPAIWFPPSGHIGTPDIRDAERLQGFDSDWTAAADDDGNRRRTDRWKLVGNAVSVPVAEWLGGRLLGHDREVRQEEHPILPGDRWPRAAWGQPGGQRSGVDASMWPVQWPRPHLHEFLEHPTRPLSARATAGFLSRTRRGNLRISEHLIRDVKAHLEAMSPQPGLLAA